MREDILQLEEELRLAMLASDVGKLNELIADSLVFTGPTGEIVSKQVDLDVHKSGVQKITQLSPLEQTIQIYDNFAVVTVKMYLVGTYGDSTITGKYRYTRVWANLDNSWKVVAGSVVQSAA